MRSFRSRSSGVATSTGPNTAAQKPLYMAQ